MMNYTIIFIFIITLLTSCTNLDKKISSSFFNDLWTIEILYLNNYDMINTLTINTIYLNEDGSCKMPIDPFIEKTWQIEKARSDSSTFEFKTKDTSLTDESKDNYLIGTFNVQFYASDEFFYMELSNDSVMVLLKKANSIILGREKIPKNTLSFEKFIPFPDFYSKYYIAGDYHFNWFKGEDYPRIDSNFKELKSNYNVLKPFFYDLTKIDSLTKVTSCFKEDYLTVEEVTFFIIDLLENYDIDELKNMNRDSCIYNEEGFNSIKQKIKKNLIAE